ncbi:MAG: glycoside hydrolase family 2 TIM barrel-domain containing protein [Planctomycetia bacterium]
MPSESRRHLRRPRRIAAGVVLLVLSTASGEGAETVRAAVPVAIEGTAAEGFRIVRGGEPFVLRGVGGDGRLDLLAACGGTSLRTWGVESCDRVVDGRPLLDAAHALGLTVTVGLWLGHERHGFDYGDRRQVERQRAAVLEAVGRFKDHPAVLLWGLGNEMEGPTGGGASPRVWREVNELARRVKAADPHHPVMPVVANVNPDKIRAILEHAPDIDLLGVNAYSGASGVGRTLRENGWTKPYCITEYGLPGPWEVEHTAWNTPIEPSSRAKAGFTFTTHQSIMEDTKQCLGGYVFLWGHKQEATSSWFGMLTAAGEKTPRVDAIARAWTGRWPADRSPVLKEADVPLAGATVDAGQRIAVRVRYEDPEGKPLTYRYEVVAESTDRKEGGDAERAPDAVVGAVRATDDAGSAEVLAPQKSGGYRLFVTASDGAGSVAIDNWCFRVR